MVGSARTQRDCRVFFLVVCCALLSIVPACVWAEPCTAAVPAATAAQAASAAGKFQLIELQCPALAEAPRVQHAEQLGLYERSDSLPGPSPGALIPAPARDTAPFTAYAQTSAAPPGRDALRVMALAPALTAAARAHNLDPLLLHAVAHVESRHNPRALSPAGARGVMQVMPATAQRMGVVGPEQALFDADTNLRAGAAYLHQLRARYGDDLRLVLAAYNAGEGAVAKYGGNVPPYPETQAYVRDVLAIYRRLSATFAVAPSGILGTRGELP